MADATRKEIGRLAMRVEGSRWVAYWAEMDTMEGAVFLGCVEMRALEAGGPERAEVRKKRFIDFMTDLAGGVLTQCYGECPEWNQPVPAPQHERMGVVDDRDQAREG